MLRDTSKSASAWEFTPFQKTEDAPKSEKVESWKTDTYLKPKLNSRFASNDILPTRPINKAPQTERRHTFLVQNKVEAPEQNVSEQRIKPAKIIPQEALHEKVIQNEQFQIEQGKTFKQKFSSIVLKKLPASRLFTVIFAGVFIVLTIATIVIFLSISIKP
jgi:hypothetical protein